MRLLDTDVCVELLRDNLFIAAIALAHDAILVTGNTRHFERVDGLRLEDWIHETTGYHVQQNVTRYRV